MLFGRKFSRVIGSWAYAEFPMGGGGALFLGLNELHAAKHLAAHDVATQLLGEFGGMLPEKCFKIVQFGEF